MDDIGRPVAGYINLCPSALENSDEKLYIVRLYCHVHARFCRDRHSFSFPLQILLHELFHVLGFSRNLFGSFRQCNDFNVCRVIRVSWLNITVQQHLPCCVCVTCIFRIAGRPNDSSESGCEEVHSACHDTSSKRALRLHGSSARVLWAHHGHQPRSKSTQRRLHNKMAVF